MKTTRKLYRLLVCASAVVATACGTSSDEEPTDGPPTSLEEGADPGATDGPTADQPGDGGRDAGVTEVATPVDAGTKRCVLSWAENTCCVYED